MTKNQINTLVLLGYMDSFEDGAILEHPQLNGLDMYVWDDSSFNDIVEKFSNRLDYAVRKRCSYKVMGH